MKPPKGSEFWRTGLHREFSEGELAEWEIQFASRPETLETFEREVELNRLIHKLPSAPVSSNFTRRVMQMVEAEHRRQARALDHEWNLWSWVKNWRTKAAFAALMMVAGLTIFQQYQETSRRELARSILQISEVLPPEQLMEDFGAMSGLRRVSLTRESPIDLLDALP